MGSQIILRVIEGNLFGNEYLFDEPLTGMIGRTSDCILAIPSSVDPRISRCHCKFEVNPPNIHICDLDSRNGTYINGVKLKPVDQSGNPIMYKLINGDRLRVGKTVFVVDLKENASVIAPIPETEQTKIIDAYKQPKVGVPQKPNGERVVTSGKRTTTPKKSIPIHNDFLGPASKIAPAIKSSLRGNQDIAKTITETVEHSVDPTLQPPGQKPQVAKFVGKQGTAGTGAPQVAIHVDKQNKLPTQQPHVAKLVGRQDAAGTGAPQIAKLVGKQSNKTGPHIIAPSEKKKSEKTEMITAVRIAQERIPEKSDRPKTARLVASGKIKESEKPAPLVAKLVGRQTVVNKGTEESKSVKSPVQLVSQEQAEIEAPAVKIKLRTPTQAKLKKEDIVQTISEQGGLHADAIFETSTGNPVIDVSEKEQENLQQLVSEELPPASEAPRIKLKLPGTENSTPIKSPASSKPKPQVAKLVGKQQGRGTGAPKVAKLVGKQSSVKTPDTQKAKPQVAKLVGKQPPAPAPVQKLVISKPGDAPTEAQTSEVEEPVAAKPQVAKLQRNKDIAKKRSANNSPLNNIVTSGSKKREPRRKAKIVIKGMPDPASIPVDPQDTIEQTKELPAFKKGKK